MNRWIVTFLAMATTSVAGAAPGPIISYVQLSTGATQSGGFNTTTGTISTLTVKTQVNSANGSANTPSYSFTNSTGTGFYLNGSSVAALSIQGAPLISWTTGPAFSPSNASGRVYIGGYPVPDAATADRLTVYTNTNGLGSTNIESADVQILNQGSGSARLVTFASEASTPSVNIIGTWGSVKSGTYWSGGPVLANSSFIEAQGAANLVFWQGTDSSGDTYFFNQNSSPTYSFHGGSSGNEYLAINNSSTTIDDPLIISLPANLHRSALQVTSDWTNKTANLNNTSGRGATISFQSSGVDKVTVGTEGSYLGNTSQNGVFAANTSNIDFYVNGNSTTTMVLGDSSSLSAPLSMSSNKITSLANGTATSDAAAYGQINYGLQASSQCTISASTSATTATFVPTTLLCKITPTSSSSRVKITVSGTVLINNTAGSAFLTIENGTTNLGPANGFAMFNIGAGASQQTPFAITYIDSPATTSQTTYTLYMRADGGSTVSVSASSTKSVMVLEEIR